MHELLDSAGAHYDAAREAASQLKASTGMETYEQIGRNAQDTLTGLGAIAAAARNLKDLIDAAMITHWRMDAMACARRLLSPGGTINDYLGACIDSAEEGHANKCEALGDHVFDESAGRMNSASQGISTSVDGLRESTQELSDTTLALIETGAGIRKKLGDLGLKASLLIAATEGSDTLGSQCVRLSETAAWQAFSVGEHADRIGEQAQEFDAAKQEYLEGIGAGE